jgi:hypothetical protein
LTIEPMILQTEKLAPAKEMALRLNLGLAAKSGYTNVNANNLPGIEFGRGQF